MIRSCDVIPCVVNDEIRRPFEVGVDLEVDRLADARPDGAGRVEEPVVEQHSAQAENGS
jgi:hypothetical protein